MPAPPAAADEAAMKSGEVTVARAGQLLAASTRARSCAAVPGRRREHRHAVAEVERLLDVVGDQHDRVGLDSRAGVLPAHCCISARVIESSEPKGSSSSSTGLPASSVRAKATRWRMPPESSARPSVSANSARPKRSNSAAALLLTCFVPARLAGRMQRQGGVVERTAPVEQQEVALRHQDAGAKAASAAPTRRPRRPGRPTAPAGRQRSRAGSTSRSPTGPPAPAPRPWRTSSDTPSQRLHRARAASGTASSDRRRPRPARPARCLPIQRLPLGSPHGHRAACSLRGDYPTGSKGQRRECFYGPVCAISARCAREPPWRT